ncbi:MAG TPA: response regulator [Bacteroidales bacterium]|nr:response regulator [Bacteroidales bacterium]
MKKITIIAYAAFVLIMVINIIFYRSLYLNQVEYSIKMIDRQVRIVGSDIDNTSMYIISDLTEIDFSDDISLFFTDKNVNERAREKIKLYYFKYEDVIVSLMLFNSAGDVYTLFKDEEKNTWIDGSYRAQTLPEIADHEKLEAERDKYKYYLPVIHDGKVLGNFVITIDITRYFSRVLAKYNLEQYQWQWLINDTGVVVYDNHAGAVQYSEVRKINDQLNDGVSGRIMHEARTGGKSIGVLSAFYPVSILGMDYGLVFSAPTDFFQKYIIRNALIMGLLTVGVIFFIISLYTSHFRKQKKQFREIKDSESTLVSIIDQMPVGIIVYNQYREILKANKHAAILFSYEDERQMTGKLVPDLSGNEYASDFNGQFGQGKIIRLGGAGGERIVFRNNISLSFNGEDATLDVFIDVTALESARKQEAEANISKSELLARMSFEIRTPLNGIIGMTEILSRAGLPEESTEIAKLIRRSADLLLNIINDIFDVSKVETGKMILDDIPFKLREEVAYCMNLVKRENPESPVRFKSEIEPGVPDNLIGDPYRLRQVITNLLYNSLSSTQTGEIQCSCSVAETSRNVLKLAFVLTDTGRTYTKAEIKKLFGDYITGRSGRAEWSEELKLGPILARHLVELMGGEIIASSPAGKDASGHGKGLKVLFIITVHLNEKIIKATDLSRYKRISDIRTLAITGVEGRDDDFLNVVHRLGLPVSVTSFQKRTVSQINSDRVNNPDRYILLIIFDEPDSDGFAVAEALHAAKLAEEYVILMFTSNDPKGHYSRCVDMGVDHLLVKPFASEDLLNILKDHFPALKGDITSSTSKDKNALPSVLVVDDNYLNRKVVGSLLKVLGIMAEFAESGKEAVEKALEKPYDLIFMDLIMPEIDGFEATRSILDFEKSSVIVALSADNMPETKAKVEQSGMKELLSKPVSVDDLRRVIERYPKES